MKYVIDTHALIWFLEGNSRLGNQAREVLADARSELVLPAIALAEAMWIVEKGKTSIPSVTALLLAIKADGRIQIVALDMATVIQTADLEAINEMHDRQIVSIALCLKTSGLAITVVSCDRNITASGLVDVIW